MVINPPKWWMDYILTVVTADGKELLKSPLHVQKPLPKKCWDGSYPNPVTLFCPIRIHKKGLSICPLTKIQSWKAATSIQSYHQCSSDAEVAGGIWTGSLALLSDSAHVFTDILAL
jgi:hypothetical protein